MGTAYNIPISCCFLKEFAGFVTKQMSEAEFDKEMKIYLPNGHSCREFRGHLLKILSEKTMFLPSIHALFDGISFDEYHIKFTLVNLFKKNKMTSTFSVNTLYELSESLSRFIKNVVMGNVDFSRMKNLVQDSYNESWVRYGDILTDCFESREIQKLIKIFETKLQDAIVVKPTSTVIAAGIGGGNFYTEKFLKNIMSSETGAVIFRGLELDQSENSNINRSLLDRISYGTKIKHIAKTKPENRIKCVQLAELQLTSEEAFAVSAAVRKAIFEEKSVLIVSTDQDLTRKIKSELKRWNIHAYDSLGEQFSRTRSGMLVFSVVEMLNSDFDTVDVIKVLKMSNVTSEYALKMELFFRKQQVVPPKFVQSYDFWLRKHAHCELSQVSVGIFKELVDKIRKKLFSPLKKKFFSEWFHICNDFISLIDPICSEEFQKISKNFLLKSDLLHHMDFYEFMIFLKNHVISSSIRLERDHSNSLVILGATEAQLLDADLVIIAGANDENWRSSNDSNSWLTKSMLNLLNLDLLDEKNKFIQCIFEQLFYRKNVLITRSEMIFGVRQLRYKYLDKLCEKTKIDDSRWLKDLVSGTQKALDSQKIIPSFPNPELRYRPIKMSVTDINLLQNNPYSFYAKKILRLRELGSINELKNIRGNYIHEVLDTFVRKVKDKTNIHELNNISKIILKNKWLNPSFFGLWFFRVPNIFRFIVSNMDNSRQSLSEIHGETSIRVSNDCVIKITCIADRIDIAEDGSISIVDYKTGSVPSMKQVKGLQSLQLLLEGLICSHDGFKIGKNSIESLNFWSLDGTKEGGKIYKISSETEKTMELIENTREELIKLIRKYNMFRTPYDFNTYYKGNLAYEHLARVKEWADV